MVLFSRHTINIKTHVIINSNGYHEKTRFTCDKATIKTHKKLPIKYKIRHSNSTNFNNTIMSIINNNPVGIKLIVCTG